VCYFSVLKLRLEGAREGAIIPTVSAPATSYYFVNADGQTEGPLSRAEIRQLLDDGMITGGTMLGVEGGRWKPARSFPEFATNRPVVRHQMPARVIYVERTPEPKSDGFGVAIVLGILFPPLGLIAVLIYAIMGKTGRAIAMLFIAIAAAMLEYAIWLRMGGGTIIIW
jgi:hypothetical protein